MEKRINSMIAMLLVVLLLYVYLLPYYVPFSSAQLVNNGSSIINGSISGIPADIPVVLFIVNNNDPNQFIPVTGLSSSNNVFSVEVPGMMLNPSDGDVIGFKINGKDTGKTITFKSGTVFDVQLQYTAPGTGSVTIVPVAPTPEASDTPVTATPIPANVTATPNSTLLPTPDLTNTPMPSIPPSARPIPGSVDPIIFAVATGMMAFVALVTGIRRL